MNIESFIQTSLQIQLLGKKLKANGYTILQVTFQDASEYDDGSDYRVFVTTEYEETYKYDLDEDIHLVED
jgi:hypothetical protein